MSTEKQINADLNKDGNTTSEEISNIEKIIKVENEAEKAEHQRKMAWTALIAILIIVTIVFTPVVDIPRLEVISNIVEMFFIVMAGIVGAYFGVSAWLSKK